MRNLFSFPKDLDLTSDKNIGKIIIILFIIIICFVASLFVQNLVKDRIERSNNALKNINGLDEFTYSPKVEVIEGENTVTGEIYRNSGKLFDAINILISTTETKTLGKQKFTAFSGSFEATGTFTESLNQNYTFSNKKVSTYKIAVPDTVDKKSILIKIDTIEKKFLVSSDNKFITFEGNFSVGTPITIQYTFSGINKIILKDLQDTTEVYKATIESYSSNIRLLNSSNSSYDKKAGTTTMEIRDGDIETGIVFLSGTDDIHFVDRITKYAILFITLVFACILYADLRKGLVINMIQYFLVGISLALFYLLVLSLGEQIGYLFSYIFASLITVTINTWYVSGVFGSRKVGYIFGSILLLLYAVLYYIIHINSINLLLGTILLYILLFMFMIASRKMRSQKNSIKIEKN